MVKRSYGQFCGVARALELVGERWALLVVRDLLVGPRRYSDLRRGLPGIPTNILASRLKELEAAGIIERDVLPRPASGVVYRLTPLGGELEPVVLALGRWGSRVMTHPLDGEVVTHDSMVMALRTTFRPEAAEGANLVFVLRVGDVVVHARVDDGHLAAAAGPAEAPDLDITAGPLVRDLMAGALSPEDALATGAVAVAGEPALLNRFAAIFAI
ncbi:HxlR family transcriptional regulator [Actinorhabdospora filicis]|uniref:HxlR family transcriptional regulator n=1 Tax=Actinorhabdospora filicis TaxID=1785913 RepID=A0A9W6SPM1_9ACTN|nr:helix-turn-helix domain-containing protein [Actinorhabdospora filicis]GLZ79704.1 HxlR family transcriptional regulator [Actinorhabdospora filicis]